MKLPDRSSARDRAAAECHGRYASPFCSPIETYLYRALSGWVVGADTETKLAGVSVAFVAGVNVGRTAQTGTDGAYQIYDLQPGTFTVRFSKAGYRIADYAFTLPGDRLVSLDARLTRSP